MTQRERRMSSTLERRWRWSHPQIGLCELVGHSQARHGWLFCSGNLLRGRELALSLLGPCQHALDPQFPPSSTAVGQLLLVAFKNPLAHKLSMVYSHLKTHEKKKAGASET